MFRRSVPVLLFLLISVCAVNGQVRDYLTDAELEIVRDRQAIDARVEVLVRAIDRRLTVLGLRGEDPKEEKKQKDDWGPMPAGTRLELLIDIKRILQKAIDDIDNLAERPDSAVEEDITTGKKNKPFSELFPKAVRTLASAADRYRPLFKAQTDTTKDPKEFGALMDSLEMFDQITAALAKLPTAVTNKKN